MTGELKVRLACDVCVESNRMALRRASRAEAAKVANETELSGEARSVPARWQEKRTPALCVGVCQYDGWLVRQVLEPWATRRVRCGGGWAQLGLGDQV